MPALLQKLSEAHRKFCHFVVMGSSQTDAYLEAFPNSSRTSATARACNLCADPLIKAEIQRLRDERDKVWDLSFAEKRAFLAEVVGVDARVFKEDGDVKDEFLHLVKHRKVTHFEDGRVVIEIELHDKLKAIQIDNAMVGHEEPREPLVIDMGAVLARIPPSTGLPSGS